MGKVEGRGRRVEGQNSSRRNGRSSRRRGRLSYGRRLRIELLEERRMLAVVTVTTLDDSVNFNDGLTSLREAIFATNVVPGADTINFAPALTANGQGTILLTQGEFKITGSLEIDGPGANLLTIDASGSDPTPDQNDGDGCRVFEFNGGVGVSVDASVSGLTLTGGDAAGGGGAIVATGNLEISRCVITGNFAHGDGGGIDSAAGFGSTALTFIHDTTISQNGANGTWSSGGGIAIGGRYQQGGMAVIQNCQILRNTVSGTWSYGGGIHVSALDTIEIVDSHLERNVATGVWASGGGLAVDGSWGAGNVLVRDSVFSGNLATDGGPQGPLGLGGWASGGGFNISAMGSIEICNNSVTGNQAIGDFVSAGGALIQDESGSVSFGHNSWIDNRVTSRLFGGGGSGGLNSSLGLPATPGDYAINSLADELPGDFNFDGTVDAADYTIWRDSLILPAFVPSVIQGDGIVLGFDPQYLRWKSHFGWTLNVCGNSADESIWDFSSELASEENVFSGHGAGNADDVVTVTTLDDGVDFNDGLTSLREAIFATNIVPAANTIDFASWLSAGGRAKILLTHGELKITDDLTVNGLGAGLLTVDASGNDPTPGWNPLPDDDSDGDGSRVFNIENADFPRYSVVVLRGLTITGGDSKASGGGINSYANLTVIDCTIVNNSARHGGGISSGGPLRVTTCTIDDNSAFYGEGGGINVDDYGLVSVTDSTISGNISYESGGGIAVSGPGSIHITNTAIKGNLAVYGSGGGIDSDSPAVITSSTISGNLCDHYGGGIWARDLTMNSCTVDSNGAARAGGGVFCESTPNQTSSSTISGSTIVNNIAYEGAGIYSAVTYLTITDVVVSDNLGGGGLQTVDGTATIANSTFSGNTTLGWGGGLRLGGPAATLTDCVIRDNVASGDYGGGILSTESDFTLTLTGCEVSNNSAAVEGGGIDNYGSSLITASKITGNTARSGGGIATGYLELVGSDVSHNKAVYAYGYYCSGGGIEADRFVIENSTIRDNSAVKGGGLFSSGMGRISKSEIRGNTAKGSGGGIFIYGDLSLADTTLSGNTAGGNGGAVYCHQGYTKASNCTISGNSAGNDGGGLYAESAWTPIIVSLANCTIVENYATVAGGGVFIASQKLAMHDSIVARNFSRVGADLTGVIGASFELHYCLVGTNASNGLVEAPVGAPDLNGNLIGGPAHGPIDYPLLRTLAYNGGPVFLDGSKLLTMAPLSDSPLFNAGDPSAMAGANGVPANDQRGTPFTRVYGGRIDMGAVESQPTPPAYFGDFNGDGSVDAADYTVWRDRMGAAVTAYTSADGDGNGMVDAADFEMWKSHFGETFAGTAAGSMEQGAGSAEQLRISDFGLRIEEVRGKAEGGGGKVEVAFSPQLSAVSQKDGGRVNLASKVEVALAVFTPGGQSPFSNGASPGPTEVTKMGTDPGIPRPAPTRLQPDDPTVVGVADGRVPAAAVCPALGVPLAAAISRSEMSTLVRDDGLLVWLAGREGGARNEERGARNDLGRKVEGGGGKVELVTSDESADVRLGAVDDVFEGLAMGV